MGARNAPDVPNGRRGRLLSGLLARVRRTSRIDGPALGTGAALGEEAAQSVDIANEPPEGAPHELHAFGLTLRVKRPSPFGAAILAVAFSVIFLGLLTYYSAHKFTRDAADLRASEEALSLADQSAYTATGDAFAGYLQILRHAEDPVVREITSTQDQRLEAMQGLLALNTNKFTALAIVARDGTIFATTDPAITDVRGSEAFNRTRSALHPTNSDIVLPGESGRGYVEFTTPLELPDGSIWAILYARADPEVLWRTTLRTSVDGSRNVIINSEGRFAAGVPDGLLRQPWRGSPLENGGVRANIVGVESICGLGPIGANTQIDHGFYVASCLPISLIHTEASRAMGQQGLVTLAGAVLAVVVAGGALWITFNGSPSPAAMRAGGEPAPEADELASRIARYRPEAPPESDAIDSSEEASEPFEVEDEAPIPPAPVIVADVDALRLIEAYERRAARVARQLRESVQARLMIASAQADEALRMYEHDPESAVALHRASIEEIESVRDRQLRALGQEMYPGLVRLGIPGALRALQKELSETTTLTLDVDADSDGAADREGRVSIEPERRLVIFRAVRETLAALVAADAVRCELVLARDGDWLRLEMRAPLGPAEQFPEDSLEADSIAFAAYGGSLGWSRDANELVVRGELPAPGVAVAGGDPHETWPPPDDSWSGAPASPDAAASPPIVTFVAPLEADGESLATALRELAGALVDFELSLDIADDFEQVDVIDPALAGTLRALVGSAARALQSAGATGAAVTLRRIHRDVYLSMMSDAGGDALDLAALGVAKAGIEAHGGQISIGHFEGSATITAEIPGDAEQELPKVVQLERAPQPEPLNSGEGGSGEDAA